MSSNLNGSAGSRPAPVVRSATEWATIMADFERSGLSQREFCDSRGLSLKTFANWRYRLRPGREGFLRRASRNFQRNKTESNVHKSLI